MKVQKIDIKSEFIDVPENSNVLKFRKTIPLSVQGKWDQTVYIAPDMANFKETVDKYTIMKLKFPDWPEVKNFAVKVGEDNLFHDLLNVRTGFIRQEVEKELIKELETELAFTKDRTIKSIKKLSWYKRLFNQF